MINKFAFLTMIISASSMGNDDIFFSGIICLVSLMLLFVKSKEKGEGRWKHAESVVQTATTEN